MTSSPLLGLPGAVAGDPPDEAVAAHYGDPLREQRPGPRFVDRSHRDVLTVSGPDRLSWLHSLTSQHLEVLTPGASTEALLLSPHGHVEHHLVLVDDGETTWIDVEGGTGPDLLAFLERMRFLLRVELRDVSSEWAVVTVLDADVPGAQQRLTRPTPWGTDVLVPRGELAAFADECRAAGLQPAGLLAFEALRVAAGRPRLGFDTDHRTIPNELPWLDAAVHLNKGCYRGQETVARTHNLGRPPRKLVLLQLDGATPSRGAQVWSEGRSVGVVGTTAQHFELGPIALALVKRRVADDAVLTVGAEEGEIAALIDAVLLPQATAPAGRVLTQT